MLPQDARGGLRGLRGLRRPCQSRYLGNKFSRSSGRLGGRGSVLGRVRRHARLVETIPANRAARIHLIFVPQISTTPLRRETPTPWRAARPP